MKKTEISFMQNRRHCCMEQKPRFGKKRNSKSESKGRSMANKVVATRYRIFAYDKKVWLDTDVR